MKTVAILAPVPAQFVYQSLLAVTGLAELKVVSLGDDPGPNFDQSLREAAILLGDYTFAHPVDAALLDRAQQLRFIQQPSVGYQHVDLEECRKRGILVANTPGVNDASVAEHTIMLALMLLRQALVAHRETAAGRWCQADLIWQQGLFELQGKTYGIIGMGNVGRELARRLRAFGTRTLYYDPRRLSAADEAELGVHYKPLEHLLRGSDVVSLHVPLTPETHHLLGAERLALMKYGAVLINVARGECVDEAALAERLRDRKLAGAGIDVYSTEPIPADHPLLGLDNVVLTPHIAGATREVRARVVETAIANIARVLCDEPPRHVVNAA